MTSKPQWLHTTLQGRRRWAEALPCTVTPWQSAARITAVREGVALLAACLFAHGPILRPSPALLCHVGSWHLRPCFTGSHVSWLPRGFINWETLEGNSWVSEILKGWDYCPLPSPCVVFEPRLEAFEGSSQLHMFSDLRSSFLLEWRLFLVVSICQHL